MVSFSCFIVSFWGLRPQTPTGALPLDPLGDFHPPDPLIWTPWAFKPAYAAGNGSVYRPMHTRLVNLLSIKRLTQGRPRISISLKIRISVYCLYCICILSGFSGFIVPVVCRVFLVFRSALSFPCLSGVLWFYHAVSAAISIINDENKGKCRRRKHCFILMAKYFGFC